MALFNYSAVGPVLQELVADGLGITLASAVLGPVVPASDNVVLESVASGAIQEVGSSAAKMFLYAQPLPDITSFADSALYNGLFIGASTQLGLVDTAFDVTGRVGLGASRQVQEGLVNGLVSVSGQFVRDQVRAMYGPSVVTDPISSLLSGKAASDAGLMLAA